MGERIPRPGEQHPEGWREDLNPNAMAGQNLGTTGPHDDKTNHTTYEIKELHERMPEFTDDELKSVPVLRLASRLEQGATYIDLRHPENGEFVALGDQQAELLNWYVPKSEVGYELWNRLVEYCEQRAPLSDNFMPII